MRLRNLCHWDDEEKDGLLNLEEADERNLEKEDYKYWSILEEVSWRQKSREIWLKEGDCNNFSFHRMANSHRRRNFIKKIRVNGIWLDGEEALRKEIPPAFQQLLSEPGG